MAENILSGKQKRSSAVSHSQIMTPFSLPMCVFSLFFQVVLMWTDW